MKYERGMTLVEVLVSLVIISVGLLGIAALQITTLRANQDAYVRSQASAVAADILDRMRANPIGARANQYAGTGQTGTRGGDDMQAWLQAVDDALPGGTGTVVMDNATNIAQVTVTWTERNQNLSFMTRSEI